LESFSKALDEISFDQIVNKNNIFNFS